MYELKPELRVLLPTLSPSLRHPSCSFSRGKSGIYRLLGKADGSAHIAYLPVRADQTLMQAGEQNPLKRVARSTMYTVTMCKHPFRGPPWDDEATQLGLEKRGQEVQYNSREFHLREMGQREANFNSEVCCVNIQCIPFVPKCSKKMK